MWDYENKNTAVLLPDLARVTLTYNGEQRRVTKETDAATQKFVYDGENLLHVTDESDLTQAVYTLDPRQYGLLVSQRQNDGGWQTLYHHFDALGSTDALTDASEVVTDTYTYYAFGELRTSTGTTANPCTWVAEVGYWKDTDLDRFHLGAREYEPEQARFISKDPLGVEPDPNVYRYVGNDSVNVVDPAGMVPPPSAMQRVRPAVKKQTINLNNLNAAFVENLPGAKRFAKVGNKVVESKDPWAVVVPNRALNGAHLGWYVFERYSTPVRYPNKQYRLIHSQEGFPAYGPAALADNFVFLPKELRRTASDVAALTFALHIVPAGAAIDQFRQGETKEAWISLAGDATLLLGGIGKVMQAARAAKVASAGLAVSRAAVAGDLIVNGGVAVYRIQQAREHWDDDKAQAAGELGEATLRLLGMTPDAIAGLRKARQALPSKEYASAFANELGKQLADPSKLRAGIGGLGDDISKAHKAGKAADAARKADSTIDLAQDLAGGAKAIPRNLLDDIVEDANRVAALGGEITDAQKTILRQNLPIVQRRSPAQNRVLRAEFNNDELRHISDWEQMTGRSWPSGATPHHIIPLVSGGANAWWNIMPTYGALPNHSLPGFPGPHAAGSVLRSTVQQGPRKLPPGTTTDLRSVR